MKGARRGFALAAVLWVLSVAAVIAAAAALQGRAAFEASRNRVNDERAYWAAQGCVARTLARIDDVLRVTTEVRRAEAWRRVDAIVDSTRSTSGDRCAVRADAVGSAIDVNAAGAELLVRYFEQSVGAGGAEALADALLDWRDRDDESRPAGAERDWYVANQRPGPRNDSLEADGELSRIRGLESRPDLVRHLSVERSPICLETAPAPVLAALPGFTPEAVQRVLGDRAEGRPMQDVNTLMSRVSRSAAESLMVHFPELAAMTAVEPRVWRLSAVAASGFPAVGVTAQVWVDHYADHLVVVRRRAL